MSGYQTDRRDQSYAAAWQKALRLEAETPVEWEREDWGWVVRSNTAPNVSYVVTVIPGLSRNTAWYAKLACTCAAALAGRPTCWHRARVALHWRRQETKKRQDAS